MQFFSSVSRIQCDFKRQTAVGFAGSSAAAFWSLAYRSFTLMEVKTRIRNENWALIEIEVSISFDNLNLHSWQAILGIWCWHHQGILSVWKATSCLWGGRLYFLRDCVSMGFCQNRCIFHCLPVKIEYWCLPCVLFSFLKWGSAQAHSSAARWANSVHTTTGFDQSPVVQFFLILWHPGPAGIALLVPLLGSKQLDKAHCLGTWWCFFFPPIWEQKKDEFLCVFSLFPITHPLLSPQPWSCSWENWGRVVWSSSKWLERWCVQVWGWQLCEWDVDVVNWIMSPSQVMLTNWEPSES